MRDKHEGGKVACDSCDFQTGKWNWKQKMAAHRRLKHGKQNLKCGLCEFETVYAKQLWDHKKRFHDGDEKMFDCNQCDYSSHLRNKINSQSLEDTQVGYILQKYTLHKYTLHKYTLEEYTFKIFKFGQNFEIWSKF